MSRTVLPETLTHPIYPLLLFELLEHRFATTKQLARLNRDQYSTDHSALRQTTRHLRTLHDAGLTLKLERRVGGWQHGSAATIWALSTTGHRAITGSHTRQRPHLTSTTFLEHLLAITEARVLLTETLRDMPETTATVHGEPDCWRRYLSTVGHPVTLKPDLAVTIHGPEFTDNYFIEIDRATENPARIIAKSWQYQHYRKTDNEQHTLGVYPKVLWITPTPTRRHQLTTHITKEPRLPQELFTVLTLDQFPDLIRNGPP